MALRSNLFKHHTENGLLKEKIPSEHKEQVAICRWMEKRGIFFTAIPNGGMRDANTRSMLKQEGVIAGAPDLMVILDEGRILWLEMKRRKGGSVSAVQKAFHKKLIELGHDVVVCKGALEARIEIEKRGN